MIDFKAIGMGIDLKISGWGNMNREVADTERFFNVVVPAKNG